jgi:MarR family transcriptional regulator, organic hydroperoxide resistance regulator
VIESPLGLPASATPEDRLCFALSVASRAMTALYRPGLGRAGLTYPQYLVMLVLWEHPSLTVGELSARLQLSTATLSPLLKRLETAGLLIRQRRAEDERHVQVRVTEAGQALLHDTVPVRADLRSAAGMAADEIGALIGRLTTLTSRLRTNA